MAAEDTEGDYSEGVAIEFAHVSFAFGRNPAVSDVTWSLSGPAVIGLLGPNGAGKTTILRLLASVLRPQSGTISVSGGALPAGGPLEGGERLERYRAILGYLPQEFGYWQAFTVAEAVAYVGWLRGLDSTVAGRASSTALERTGLGDLADRRMRTLSGGEKRRVGLAQAIVNDPQVLLLDEPTAGLDPEQRLKLRELIGNLGRSSTVVLCTHLVEDVAAVCDLVAVMGRSRLLFTGTPTALSKAGTTSGGRPSAIEAGYVEILRSRPGSERGSE